MSRSEVSGDADLAEKVLRSLRSDSEAWVYVAGDRRGQPVWGSWYLTGPTTRRNYVAGPIPASVISDLARRKLVVPEVVGADNHTQAYRAAHTEARP